MKKISFAEKSNFQIEEEKSKSKRLSEELEEVKSAFRTQLDGQLTLQEKHENETRTLNEQLAETQMKYAMLKSFVFHEKKQRKSFTMKTSVLFPSALGEQMVELENLRLEYDQKLLNLRNQLQPPTNKRK